MNHPNQPAPAPTTIPEGYVLHMPHQIRSHAYGGPKKRIAPEASDTGLEQFEKPCLKCGTVRITIPEAQNPRAWRAGEGGLLLWREPVCEPVAVANANEVAA